MLARTALFLITILLTADAAQAEPTSIEEFKTDAGTFKIVRTRGTYVEPDSKPFGLMHETVVTPSGRRIRAFPECYLNEQCVAKDRSANTIDGITAVQGIVYAITDDGLYQYIGGMDMFVRLHSWRGEHQAYGPLSTAYGDVYLLGPDDGNITFEGILYYNKSARVWKLATVSVSYGATLVLKGKGVVYEDGTFRLTHQDPYSAGAYVTTFDLTTQLFNMGDVGRTLVIDIRPTTALTVQQQNRKNQEDAVAEQSALQCVDFCEFVHIGNQHATVASTTFRNARIMLVNDDGSFRLTSPQNPNASGWPAIGHAVVTLKDGRQFFAVVESSDLVSSLEQDPRHRILEMRMMNDADEHISLEGQTFVDVRAIVRFSGE